MRDYIFEQVKNSTRHFKFGPIDVEEIDPITNGLNINAILKAIEEHFPSHYFKDLKSIKIQHLPEFDERQVNAVYRDNQFIISNQQDNTADLMDDLIHEFAHHLETLYPELIYSDKKLINEFLQKRHQLKFELQSEGYWVREYNFDDLKFNQSFDNFLYKRVGRNMLRLATTGLFIRPYGAVSLREYFGTGFEAFYLGQEDTLQKISPVLYNKIKELHNYTD
jgi:hypothetical protein